MEVTTMTLTVAAVAVYALGSFIAQVIGFVRSRQNNEPRLSQEARVLFTDVNVDKSGKVSLLIGTDEGVYRLPDDVESLEVFDSLEVAEGDDANIKVKYRARYDRNKGVYLIPVESVETL
jgi:hypothetical protein